MTIPNWLDSNGLVAGKIPTGTACHMAKTCNRIAPMCPTEEKPREVDFSCALARLGSLVKLSPGPLPGYGPVMAQGGLTKP
jgi:hypothetical protein